MLIKLSYAIKVASKHWELLYDDMMQRVVQGHGAPLHA
jgi:hypothetical protein